MTVEVTTRYATTVDSLADAWSFIMARLDTVGPDPSVSIRPIWVLSDDDNDRRFEVAVEGMVER